ncbi:MAG: hypothetical protein ACFCUG_14485 [Thiotrichales bacterium]
MTKLDEKLAASVKPAGAKKPGTKSTATAVDEANSGTTKSSHEDRSAASPERAQDSSSPNLNDPARPLHPRRIWPD